MLKTAMDNLKFIINKSQKEIVELLNANRITTGSLIFRVKDVLKKDVKKLYKEELE
jgi:hypothetical protein